MTRRLLTAALTAAALLPAAASAQSSTDIYDPNTPPPGANDFACKPSAAHPNPVVLVHGLGANMQANWYYMAPRLADAGYCVFALTYGRNTEHPPPFDQNGGLIPMEQSVLELADLIDRVLTATGAHQVDIVGHSEGSLMPNYYVKFLPESRYPITAESKVKRYVGLTPLWDGTDVAMAATIGDATGGREFGEEMVSYGCESCPSFIKGSAFLEKMNSGGGPRVPGVDYTMIMTRYDELVQPYTSGEMDGATNIVVQDQCPADPSEHLAVAANPIVLRDVLNALDPANADPVVDCIDALEGW